MSASLTRKAQAVWSTVSRTSTTAPAIRILPVNPADVDALAVGSFVTVPCNKGLIASSRLVVPGCTSTATSTWCNVIVPSRR